jgi:hypothetical protein
MWLSMHITPSTLFTQGNTNMFGYLGEPDHTVYNRTKNLRKNGYLFDHRIDCQGILPRTCLYCFIRTVLELLGILQRR